jgi:D-sedoheptulose 7-phosphate isomerase
MQFYKKYSDEIAQTLQRLPWDRVQQMVDRLHAARMNHHQVFVMGNGGSASTASHLACDLGKNTIVEGQPRFRIQAFTDNMAIFSAYANDCGYENVFAEQVQSFVRPGDVVIAISASGNSPNVLKAVSLARSLQAHTIGWSGYEGGALADLVDISIVVPNHCIEQIEDIHLILEHMVTTALRTAITNEANALAELGGEHVHVAANVAA